MDNTATIWSFLTAALLGFLIGLERERKREVHGSIFAGVRTFPLIAVFGSVCGRLHGTAGPWILVAGFFAMTVLVGLGYWRQTAGEKVGGTTEVAILVAFGLGIIAGLGAYAAALAGAVIATGILSLREELHNLVGALGREDLFAVVQFATVSLIVLPLVPNEELGPWGVWNPRTIWLLVVLISGVSFVGYVAVKAIGARRGIGLSGLLGGLASSTAATLSFSERSRATPQLDIVLAAGALAATAVAAPRLLVLLGIAGQDLLLPAMLPLGALFVVSTVTGLLFARRQVEPTAGVKVTNPFELRTALQFALLFALILLVTRAAEEFLGAEGVYIASALGGITQLDAITLSLARQTQSGLDPGVAARGLALAVAANSVFKGVLAVTIGGRLFGQAVLWSLLASAVAVIAAGWWLPPLLS